MSTKRILASVLILITVLTTPYWIYVPLIFLAIFLLPLYFEGILFGFLVDVLYGVSGQTFILFDYPYALATAVFVFITPFIQQRLRFHA